MRFLLLVVIITLTGCASIEGSVKRVTDEVCSMTELDKQALAAKFDEITAPNKVRVICGTE